MLTTVEQTEVWLYYLLSRNFLVVLYGKNRGIGNRQLTIYRRFKESVS
jgi:hypothetical protein